MDKIEVKNLVPKFLEFYRRANDTRVDNEQRWKLWKDYYNFAAVPPGEDGQKLARTLLDEAWYKYEKKITYIKNFQPNGEVVQQHLLKVKKLLGYEESINLILIYFVGGFENNPFVAPYDEDRIALCLPIEEESTDIILAHELTHIVHAKTANLKVTWERTIAALIIQEGLATQVSKAVVPGYNDDAYIAHEDGWLAACKVKRNEILKGIYPYLNDTSSDTLLKFTFGEGTTHTEREAYFAGWEIVKFLLEESKNFKDIASIQESNIPDYLEWIYPEVLRKGGN